MSNHQNPPNLLHRHTRSAAGLSSTTASLNTQAPHHLKFEAHTNNAWPNVVNTPQPTTPPRTPKKTGDNAVTESSIAVAASVTKTKSKNKNRPRNVTTSSPGSRNDRSTPTLTGIQSTSIPTAKPMCTPSAAAYAGPTFHASPAPSALPIPSFYSKSVPDSPDIRAFSGQTDENSSTGSDSPTPSTTQVLAPQPRREESPLDIFFRADRAEKERARSTNSHLGSKTMSGPFRPPLDSPPHGRTTPQSVTERKSQVNQFAGGATGGLFAMDAMELDGTNSQRRPYGPSFSTPYNERINAARSSRSAIPSSTSTPTEREPSLDPSEALKEVLFNFSRNSSILPRIESPNVQGEPRILMSTPGKSSRNASLAGLRDVSGPSRQQNSFPVMNGSITSINPARESSRSSGLRQEMTPNETSALTPGQPHLSSQLLSQLSDNNSSATGDHIYSHSPSVTPSRKSRQETNGGTDATNFREMEDELRRVLKIGPSSSSNF